MMSKSTVGRKRTTNKHTDLKYKSGRALQKITGKSLIDWAYLCKRFPHHKVQIKAHRSDQEYLKNLRAKLMST